jgi:hypothetical protein
MINFNPILNSFSNYQVLKFKLNYKNHHFIFHNLIKKINFFIFFTEPNVKIKDKESLMSEKFIR